MRARVGCDGEEEEGEVGELVALWMLGWVFEIEVVVGIGLVAFWIWVLLGMLEARAWDKEGMGLWCSRGMNV